MHAQKERKLVTYELLAAPYPPPDSWHSVRLPTFVVFIVDLSEGELRVQGALRHLAPDSYIR